MAQYKIGLDARMYSTKFTGIGRYTHELLQELLRIDQKNEYIVFVNEEGRDLLQNIPGRLKVVYVGAGHYSFKEQTRYASLLKQEKLDLMHFAHFNAPIFYRGKSIVTIHDLTLSFFPGSKMNGFLHRLAYHLVIRSAVAKACYIIAVSQNTKNDLMKLLSVADEKIQVIYEGANERFLEPCSSQNIAAVQSQYSLKTPFFLYTGVLREHKNVLGLIQAFALFLKSNPQQNMTLVITGRDDPKYAHVKQLPLELGIQKQVKFLGLVPEDHLVALFQAAYAYVYPSFYEGFGLPPLEAMAARTPVVASRVSSIPEVCGEGNALYFDPYSVADMAQKMKIIMEDQVLYQQLVANGAKRVTEFSWKKMALETYQIYMRALQ